MKEEHYFFLGNALMWKLKRELRKQRGEKKHKF